MFFFNFIAKNFIFSLLFENMFDRDNVQNIDKNIIAYCTDTQFNCDDGIYELFICISNELS